MQDVQDRLRARMEAQPVRFLSWTGTSDPTPFLCVPAAIEFMASLLPGGWPAAMAHNRRVALDARRRLCTVLGIPVPSPDEMIGSLASIRLPDGVTDPPGVPARRDVLQDRLFARFGIEVPVMRWPAPSSRLVRISAQLYDTPAQFEKLADALVELLREERG